MRLAIVGTGNLAYHLSLGLENAGHQIAWIVSRDIKNAKKLCDKLYEAKPSTSLVFDDAKLEGIILAVSDDAIQHVASHVKKPSSTFLIHLSGSKSLTILGNHQPKGGVYPLYSFTKDAKAAWNEITFFVESQDPLLETKLFHLAKSLGSKSQRITADKKMALHIAAVFAQNFSNHMLKIAHDICEAEQISFNSLKSLVLNGIEKAFLLGPENSQTGPAIRKDLTTIETHLQFLAHNTSLNQLYKLISEHIIETYNE